MITSRSHFKMLVCALGLSVPLGCHQMNHDLSKTSPPPNAAPTAPKMAPEQATMLNPKQMADMQISLGRSFEGRGKLEDAQASYKRALQHDPSRGDACTRLAITHDKQAKFKLSEELHKKALQMEANNADFHCNYGYSLYLQHRLPEAEKMLTRALELKPDHKRAQNNLGLVLARTGRQKEALVAFHRGGCQKADAHANVAFALSLEQNWESARDQYQLALASNPTSDVARKGMEELKTLSTSLGRSTDGKQSARVSTNPGDLAKLSSDHEKLMGVLAKTQAKTIVRGAPLLQQPQMDILPAQGRKSVQPALNTPPLIPETSWNKSTTPEMISPRREEVRAREFIASSSPRQVESPRAGLAGQEKAQVVPQPEPKRWSTNPKVISKKYYRWEAKPVQTAPQPAPQNNLFHPSSRMAVPSASGNNHNLFQNNHVEFTSRPAEPTAQGSLFNPSGEQRRPFAAVAGNNLFNPGSEAGKVVTPATANNLFNPNAQLPTANCPAQGPTLFVPQSSSTPQYLPPASDDPDLFRRQGSRDMMPTGGNLFEGR